VTTNKPRRPKGDTLVIVVIGRNDLFDSPRFNCGERSSEEPSPLLASASCLVPSVSESRFWLGYQVQPKDRGLALATSPLGAVGGREGRTGRDFLVCSRPELGEENIRRQQTRPGPNPMFPRQPLRYGWREACPHLAADPLPFSEPSFICSGEASGGNWLLPRRVCRESSVERDGVLPWRPNKPRRP